MSVKQAQGNIFIILIINLLQILLRLLSTLWRALCHSCLHHSLSSHLFHFRLTHFSLAYFSCLIWFRFPFMSPSPFHFIKSPLPSLHLSVLYNSPSCHNGTFWRHQGMSPRTVLRSRPPQCSHSLQGLHHMLLPMRYIDHQHTGRCYRAGLKKNTD